MLTSQERKIIHKACELLELGKREFSCMALATACMSGEVWPQLTVRYSQFYGHKHPGNWSEDPAGAAHRILLLLLFAEAEGDV